MMVPKLGNTTNVKSKSAKMRIAAVSAVAATLALAACSPGGTNNSSATGGAGAENSASGVNIVVIGGSGDPFFATIQRGVDSATKSVEAAGGKVTYLALKNYENLGPDTAQLTETAISQKPSAIAVPDWVPDAQNAAIKKAVDAGIPVLLYNAGDIDSAKELGAMSYVGTDDRLAGVAAGKSLGEAGAKNVLCVNTTPGAANNENRCAGAKEGVEGAGGKSSQLSLPSTNFGNQTAVTQAIKSAVLQDPSIDGVVTIGVTDSESAKSAIEQANAKDRVKLIGFDLSPAVLDAVKSGAQYAAIDQQPFAQGYYAVSALFHYTAYGVELPTKPILTGPLVVTKDNVEAAVKGSAVGAR